MSRHLDEIWYEQEARQKKYPKDRIAFIHAAASNDAAVFQRFKDHRMTLLQAMDQIAKNNFLKSITEEQFMTEYRICGYTATQSAEDEYGRYY